MRVYVSMIALLASWFLSVGIAQAQGGVVWSQPERLSDPDFRSGAPAIAADAAGNVHVMWSQEMTDARFPAEGDALYYRRWDGQSWTPPVDVLALPGQGAQFPALAVTPDGTLHVVWTTGGRGQVMYAQAPACCADNPHNWSQPISLGGPSMQTVALALDAQGGLHVAYAPSDSVVIVYRRSDDGGLTWPLEVDIPGGASRDDEYTIYPRLAIDGLGRVHAVWIVEPWAGRYAMYARSDDRGTTWSPAQVIDRFDSGAYFEGYGPEYIDIEARGDAVHLIWDGAPTVERHHIWSSDGGKTWSEPLLLFPEIKDVGRAGWNDMAFDSAGTLHAVSLGKPLHASWSGGLWSASGDASRADEAAVPGGEWVAMTVRLGNQLHVLWLDKFKEPFAVWHASGIVNAPEAPAVEQKAVAPAAAETSTTLPPASLDVTATQATTSPQVLAATIGTPSPQSRSNDAAGIMVGTVAAGLVVGGVFIASLRRKVSKT